MCVSHCCVHTVQFSYIISFRVMTYYMTWRYHKIKNIKILTFWAILQNLMPPFYLPRVYMRKGVKQSFCSVCQSVCLVKNFEISTSTRFKNCFMWQRHVPDRDQSSSLLCISSSFNIAIVHQWRVGICWLQARVCVYQPPHSQDCEKLGGRLGTTQHIHLGAQVSEIQHVFSVKKPERSYEVGLNGVGQLFHKVSHLLYKVGQLLWEVHLLTAVRGCGRRVYKTFDFPSLQPALIL